MYKVRLKRFADTEQIQILEHDFFIKESGLDFDKGYLLDRCKTDAWVGLQNPFYDNQVVKMKKMVEVDEEESVRVSRARTINKIYDICRSDVWEWFVTLTFDPDKVDRYDYAACTKKLSKWLNNMRRNCPDMKYLFVPEPHKDGAWHFHGFMKDVDGLNFVESGHFTADGRIIYNVGRYAYGFTTATRVEDTARASSYICKYITKDLCRMTKGKKRYWASRNVKLPEITDFIVDMDMESILRAVNLNLARISSREGYVNVTYVDVPIYSTNTCFTNRYI